MDFPVPSFGCRVHPELVLMHRDEPSDESAHLSEVHLRAEFPAREREEEISFSSADSN